ncbi:30S ribosomal protein S3 [Candidatus Gottesmanbacteria bacterium RIFCSPHIGHO2_01_FULL_42_12]|uniref:Small ribosomal subunit protein uS3 n=1 Tax=Candidatus Gottesmanbacteria bacterium RIFCSPHIGHO2_01_FULL_42_12 TaxID=1798377 RepID=A0A1F5Z549_9BACT|nr:MAG: 30S ribosomal protein S3 [Candidatus Gottesmanbacteria bacterium RIFCSPHIGHO2_01_FULL_42_12]
MGQKINPIAFRLGKFYTWDSRWFSTNDKRYRETLLEDVNIRKELAKRLKVAGLTKVEIERSINKLNLTLHVTRPGLVIGRGGTGLEDLKKYIVEKILKIKKDEKNTQKIDLKIEAVKEPNLNAQFMAQTIADQLGKRMMAKRVMNQAIEKIMASGAKGARVQLGGRINGAEISRIEHVQKGVLPLTTLREKIEYAQVHAPTRSGYIGVKVWVCLS